MIALSILLLYVSEAIEPRRYAKIKPRIPQSSESVTPRNSNALRKLTLSSYTTKVEVR